MSDASFTCPDLTTVCRLDVPDLIAVGQCSEPDRAVLTSHVSEPDRRCRRCGCEGVPRGTLKRGLAHEPVGWCPPTLLVTVRRYQCTGCEHGWRQATAKAAESRARLSQRALRWALAAIICQNLTVVRVAETPGEFWNTAHDAVLAEGKTLLHWRTSILNKNSHVTSRT